MRILRSVVVLVLAVAFVVSLTGCELIAQKAVEGATGVKVDESGGKTTIETPQGTASVSEGSLPDGFPAEVPIYQPSTVQSAIMTDGDKGKSYLVGLVSTDDAKTVGTWYKDQLATNGWTTKSTVSSGDGGAMYNATNGTIDLTIVIGPGSGEEAGKTSVSLAAGPAQQQ